MERIPIWAWLLMALAGIVVLVALGLRIAPSQQPANSAEARQACKLEAPEALKAAGAQWCAIGLFAQVNITEDEKTVIAVMNFSPNGAEAWQVQSSGLINEFRSLTDRLARDAGGNRDVSVDVHDALDKRIAVCARLTTAKMAECEQK